MLKKSLILFFTLSTFVSSGQSIDTADYAIYNLLLTSNVPVNKKSVTLFNLTSRSEYYNPLYGNADSLQQIVSDWWRVFQSPFDSSAYALFRAFDAKRPKAKVIRQQFKLPFTVVLIYPKSFKKLFRKSVQRGWQQFYKKYPESAGVFEFSDVHYSTNKSQAVVYYAVRRNGLNGSGRVVILDKKEGSWKITQAANLWAN